jgi:hypothetical protein
MVRESLDREEENMDPIEALADAIMRREGWSAGSRSERNRNPGNLRDSPYANGHDADGYATFAGMVEGYTGLCADLRRKFSGRNTHGLNGDSTLLQLFEVYAPADDNNAPLLYAVFVGRWLTTALGQDIQSSTTLREIAPEACGPALAPTAKVTS